MKTIITILMVGFSANMAFAQKMKESEVPSAVQAAFAKSQPGIKAKEWEKEGGNFEVEYESRGKDVSLLMDAKGNILETEEEIELEALPKAAKDYVNVTYKGNAIKESSKITDSKGVVSYEAEIKGMDLMFDQNGKFIRSEMDKEEKGEKHEMEKKAKKAK